MAREPKYGVTINGWERLLASLEANAKDFPQFEGHRAQLADLLREVKEASAQQVAMAAAKQDATKRVQSVLTEGRKLATLLRVAVKQHYGNKAEKLVEFDLKPLRIRRRTNPDGIDAPGTPTPAKTETPVDVM
jgi:hypothetical protein